MPILTGTGILSGKKILDGTKILFQSGILVPPSTDPDAEAYFALIEAAGAAPNAAQKTVISDFYIAAKAEGYYTSLKRLYLPIWGVAAANAIDMIGGTSGTWNGGVTHGAGFVQGDGTTGYFDFAISPNSLGLNDSSSLSFALVKTAPTGSGFNGILSAYVAGTNRTQLYVFDNEVQSHQSGDALVNHSGTRATNTGIYVANRESTTSLELFSRKTSGLTKHSTNTTSVAGGAASTANISAMAQGAGAIPSDGQFGLYGLGLGLSDALVDSFTSHLKNLWESCTGNVLP